MVLKYHRADYKAPLMRPVADAPVSSARAGVYSDPLLHR
jgi:hypothetical protein